MNGKFEEASIGIFAYDKNIIPYLNNGIKFDSGIYAKLQEGDIITKIDGNKLNKMADLREYIYKKNPGDEVTLTVLRDKIQIDLKIKLIKK